MALTDKDAARLRELGRLDEAANILHQILNLHPQDVGALAELGRVLRHKGDRTAALEVWVAAATANPNHAGLKAEVALDLLELGRLDEAETLLRHVLENEPKHVESLVGLAQIARRKGDRLASLAAFEAASAANPDHHGIKAELAADLRELSRIDEAEAVLRQVLESEPKHVESLVELAHIARSRGDRLASLARSEERRVGKECA